MPVYGTRPSPAMAKKSLDDVVGAAGKEHSGPARQFLINEAPAGIDFPTMRAIASDRRVVLAEDPGRAVQTLVVPGGHLNLHCKRYAYSYDRLLWEGDTSDGGHACHSR